MGKREIRDFTKKMARIGKNLPHPIRDYPMEAAGHIINYCFRGGSEKSGVGYNLEIKNPVDKTAIKQQKFVQSYPCNFAGSIKAANQEYGLAYQKMEASYNCQVSFLDGDEMPFYKTDTSQKYELFYEKQLKCGLNSSKHSFWVNAELNGVANILLKSKHRHPLARFGKKRLEVGV